MNRRISFATISIGLLATFICSAYADSWALPQVRKYFSANKKFYVEVTPKKLESQLKYFEDKSAGRDNAGAVKGTREKSARAAFYELQADGTSYSKKSEFPLVNEVSPVSALVSDTGDYFVTFDNWHSMGYGDNVVVIYRAGGSIVQKLGLEGFLTKKETKSLPRTVSSIWWGGEHYIDEANGVLVLKVAINSSMGERERKYSERKIELASGKVLNRTVE